MPYAPGLVTPGKLSNNVNIMTTFITYEVSITVKGAVIYLCEYYDDLHYISKESKERRTSAENNLSMNLFRLYATISIALLSKKHNIVSEE